MSREDRTDLAGLLRWYPPEWRARDGDELVACIEDELDGRHPTVRLRVTLATAGLRQRARATGIAGDGTSPAVRVRAGALVVLVAWAVLVVGGAAYAKAAEHFASAGSAASQALAGDAYRAVVALAVLGTGLVGAGLVVAVPATGRLLRAGGWGQLRRPLARAVAASVASVGATVGLASWAHLLDVAQRNGADAGYVMAFSAWALLGTVTVGLWTAAGVSVARRIDLGPAVLRVEAGLAVATGAVVVATAAAVGLWWSGMATTAPWFLAGTRPGTHPSPVTLQLVTVGGCLAVACALAAYGALRVVRGLRVL